MPSQNSSDTGFYIMVVLLVVTLSTLAYFYGFNKPQEVVIEEPVNFVPRQFVPHEREADIQAAVSRSQEREKKPKPKPTPAVTPTPTATPKPSPKPDPSPKEKQVSSSGMPSLLLLIRSHESGGNYSAYNASGCEGYGCGGAYQLHAKYAATWAARAGYPGLSGQAQNWSPAIQDAVALKLFYSTNPDGAHWCNWTDYC